MVNSLCSNHKVVTNFEVIRVLNWGFRFRAFIKGLAFQLIDDVLYFTAILSSLGKGSLSDICHGIVTAPILFAIEEFPDLRPVVLLLEEQVVMSIGFIAFVVVLHVMVRKLGNQTQVNNGDIEKKNRQYTYPKVLGKGGFGTVYHGYVGDLQVAVKMLSPSSTQGYKEFQTELDLCYPINGHRGAFWPCSHQYKGSFDWTETLDCDGPVSPPRYYPILYTCNASK